MIKKSNGLKTVKSENLRGGNGIITLEHLIEGEELKKNGKLFARITVPKGGSIGMHDHTNDYEVYYILSGIGRVLDQGLWKEVSTGDVVYTANGEEHGIENIGDEELVFLGIVIYS